MIQLSRLLVRVLSRGTAKFGLSRLAVVTSISSGKSALTKVSCVPHSEQKDRLPFAVELKRAGQPLVKRKSTDRTLNHVANGAPVVRRQIEQWQFVW